MSLTGDQQNAFNALMQIAPDQRTPEQVREMRVLAGLAGAARSSSLPTTVPEPQQQEGVRRVGYTPLEFLGDPDLPEWLRRVGTGLDPQYWAGTIMTLPEVPSMIAAVAGAPETAEALSSETGRQLADWGASQLREAERRYDVTPYGDVTLDEQGNPEFNFNMWDLIAQEGPAMAVPIGGPVRLLSNATRAGRATNAAANVGINLALPGVQGRYVPGLMVSEGATVGLPATLAAVSGGEFSGDYTTQAEMLERAQEELTLRNEGMITGPIAPDVVDVPDAPDDYSAEIVAGISAVAIIAGVRAGIRANHAGRAAEQMRAASDLSNNAAPSPSASIQRVSDEQVNQITGPITDRRTAVETQAIDRFAPLWNAARRAGADVEQIQADVRTTATPQGMSARIRDMVITGQLPNSNIMAPSLVNMLQQISRMTPQQRAAYNDALTAYTRLDDMHARNTTVWRGHDPDGAPVQRSMAELQALVRTGMNDPQVRSLINESHTLYRRMTDYMLEAGVVSRATHQRWRQQMPHYAPQSRAFHDAPLMQRLFRETDPAIFDRAHHLRARGDEEQIAPGFVRNAEEAHLEYVGSMLRLTENNRLRRNFIDQIINLRDRQGNRVVRRIPPNEKSQSAVAIRRGGLIERYEISDPGIYSSLRFRPTHVWQAFDIPRRIFQQATTGIYMNPLQVLRSVAYETTTALPLTRSGRGLGPLDQILSNISDGKWRLGAFDYSVFASPVSGTALGVYSNIVRRAHQALDLSVRTNGVLSRVLGPANAQAISGIMKQNYMRSSGRLFERYGSGNAAPLENTLDARVSPLISEVASAYGRVASQSTLQQLTASRIIRAYSDFMHIAHNSVRQQNAASNIRRQWYSSDVRLPGMSRSIKVVFPWNGRVNMSNAELTRVMADTRRLTGDPTQVGGDSATRIGRAVQGFLSGIPYGNLSIQVMAEIARGIRRNPARALTSFGTLLGAGLTLQFASLSDNPAAQEYYWHRLTPEQRARNIYIFGPDGEPIFLNSLHQEMRLAWSPLIEGMGVAFGFRSASPSEMTRTVYSTLMNDVLPDPIGPTWGIGLGVLGGTLALAGQQMDVNIPEFGGRFGVQTPRPIRGDVQQETLRTELADNAQIVLSELLGGAATMWFDGANSLTQSIDEGYSLYDSLRNSSEALLGVMRQPERTSFFNPVWGIEQRVHMITPETRDLRVSLNNIDLIGQAFNRDVRRPGFGTLSGDTPTPFRNNNLRGTEVAYIGSVIRPLQAWLRQNYSSQRSHLSRNLDQMRMSAAFTDPAVANQTRNRLVEQIRELDEAAMQQVQTTESLISQQLGRDFRFSEFNLDESSSMPSPSLTIQ